MWIKNSSGQTPPEAMTTRTSSTMTTTQRNASKSCKNALGLNPRIPILLSSITRKKQTTSIWQQLTTSTPSTPTGVTMKSNTRMKKQQQKVNKKYPGPKLPLYHHSSSPTLVYKYSIKVAKIN